MDAWWHWRTDTALGEAVARGMSPRRRGTARSLPDPNRADVDGDRQAVPRDLSATSAHQAHTPNAVR